VLELLAEAGHEEQRVVDREAEPEADHEVQREDREPVDLVDQGEGEERPEHRGHPDREREHRGAPAEEDERQQQQDRERERLGPAEVGRDAVTDLGAREQRAAERDVVGVLEAIVEAGHHRVLVGVGVERRRDVRRATVAADEALVLRRLDGGHRCDARLGGERPLHRRDAIFRLRRLDARGRAEQRHDARRRLRAGRLLDALHRTSGARVRRREAARLLERAGHGSTEDAGDHDEEDDGEQPALRAGGDAVGQGCEHGGSSSGSL
jgi:hypothetical protein